MRFILPQQIFRTVQIVFELIADAAEKWNTEKQQVHFRLVNYYVYNVIRVAVAAYIAYTVCLLQSEDAYTVDGVKEIIRFLV